MKWLPLSICLMFFSAPDLYSFSSKECEEYLAGQEVILNQIGQFFAQNMQSFRMLDRPDFYGVVNSQNLQIKYKGSIALSFSKGNPGITRPIIFGQNINFYSIPGWLGYGSAWLHCIEYAFNAQPPFEVCCIYDERKKRRSPSSEENPDFGAKRLKTMDYQFKVADINCASLFP